jgi:GT2 family glycosyltransferase
LLHGQINGCSLLIHKNHFERVGVFNENLLTTQDYDLWFRIMRNARIVCYSEALSITRIHERQGSKVLLKPHSEESDNLWIYMMESLTEQEKLALDGTIINFYQNIYQLLLSYTANRQAIAYAKRQAYKEQRKMSSGLIYLIKAFGLVLSGYSALISEFITSIKEAGISNTLKRVKHMLLRLLQR